MLMRGDFDLNSVQICTESLKEALKQGMLNQEVIFRKQVEELHRLYTTQKTLMENLAWREFHTYNSRKPRTQPSLLSCANPKGYETFTKETTFSSILMVGPTQSTGCVSAEGQFRQRPLDLQLPTDQYIRHVGSELKVSPGSGEYHWSKGCAKRTWSHNEDQSRVHHVIDLEESIERVSNEDEKCAPFFCNAAHETHITDNSESEVSVLSESIISSSVKKDLPVGIADNCSLVDSKRCEEQNYSNKGFKSSHVSIPNLNLPTMLQESPSSKVVRVDLNKVQLDDSSCDSDDLMVSQPSAASPAHVFIDLVGRDHVDTCASPTWRKRSNNCTNETVDMICQDDAMNSSLDPKKSRAEILARTSKFDGMGGTEVGTLGFEALRPSPGPREVQGCHSSDFGNGNVGLLPDNLLNEPNRTCRGTRQMNFEKSEVVDLVPSGSDQSRTTVLDGSDNISPASCKSRSSIDNDVNSLKTEHSGNEMGSSNLLASDHLSGTNIVSQGSETVSVDQEQGSSDSSASKHESGSKKEESCEADEQIHRAAESLLHFSLEISSGKQDCSTKAILTETKNEKREQPQYSTDSFELITLNIKECSAEDYCVSSKPLEVNEVETNDFSLKLRRGRRLKDFQKDILPGLPSLSRHEILEDVNILEAVLRSREYKKIRAGMANGHCWSTPVRSRRSTLKQVGRKRF